MKVIITGSIKLEGFKGNNFWIKQLDREECKYMGFDEGTIVVKSDSGLDTAANGLGFATLNAAMRYVQNSDKITRAEYKLENNG